MYFHAPKQIKFRVEFYLLGLLHSSKNLEGLGLMQRVELQKAIKVRSARDKASS